jgi:hypothetical protein
VRYITYHWGLIPRAQLVEVVEQFQLLTATRPIGAVSGRVYVPKITGFTTRPGGLRLSEGPTHKTRNGVACVGLPDNDLGHYFGWSFHQGTAKVEFRQLRSGDWEITFTHGGTISLYVQALQYLKDVCGSLPSSNEVVA